MPKFQLAMYFSLAAVKSMTARNETMQSAGIILCGGKSKRMGCAKALLPFGEELLLQRIVRILSEVVHPLVVVASRGQFLPDLSDGIEIVYDRQPDCGPLEGLATGLWAIPRNTSNAFVTGCDTPFINPSFIDRILALLTDYKVAVPKADGRYHPLCAAFSRDVLPDIETMLDAGERRMGFLIESTTKREVLPLEWNDVDPCSKSLCNLNTPEDYANALREIETH